ncbi:hypothetical protein POM88_016040 [Heracleum sosnowskyi]|uniref:acireductone dioxygenase (Fe(2+)-requiring) n=1 Tax=Heracleum sosnowskyi TaxID=360622 RepID=A0AAD8IL97_9APIA|nr:hypothetical protein POM88_016040 [Heracleum sosnowskyi]
MMNQPSKKDIESMNLLLTIREQTKTAQQEADNTVKQIDTERRELAAQVRADATRLPFDFEVLNNRLCRILSLSSQFAQAQTNAQPHIVAAKIESTFLPDLVAAPLFEVKNVDDATYLVNLRKTKAWSGKACLTIGVDNRVQINNVLEGAGVPVRFFMRTCWRQQLFKSSYFESSYFELGLSNSSPSLSFLGGYYDVRDINDRWIRVMVKKGGMIILPAGMYHRFTLDANNHVKCMTAVLSIVLLCAVNLLHRIATLKWISLDLVCFYETWK